MPTAKTNASGPCACTALRKASRRISQLYDAVLAPLGLKATQRSILAHLERTGPVSVGRLAELLVMDAGGLAHTLKPLRRDGLLSIDPDPQDRRGRIVSLSNKGRDLFQASLPLWSGAQADFEARFGKARARVLHEALAFIVSEEFSQK